MAHKSSYTIGWICAIRVEFDVACELLDEEYRERPVGIPTTDTNPYHFGRIDQHYVVIACLPAGKYGTTHAASVATKMSCTFSSITSYLMVGIAGGAWSPSADVRLGDVVVSMPDQKRRENGVVCYRQGRVVQDQPFQRTGTLSAPPKEWLNAMINIQSKHARKGHCISKTVADMLSQNHLLTETCSRPDSSLDILFQSTSVHGHTDRSCVETCMLAQEEMVFRKHRKGTPNEPRIHYGLIASSDVLLKDAIVRDALVDELGVLCIEMEAAGLLDHIPCIVVRGICDYADTHKNDAWQGYAAACAAAYAKELVAFAPHGKVPLVRDHDTMQSPGQPLYPNDLTIMTGPALPVIGPNAAFYLFDQLTTSPLYMASGRSVWQKLTLFSWLTYEEIYEAMLKDEDGKVSQAAFELQIPSGTMRDCVAKHWVLLPKTSSDRRFKKSYAMALLFMLHMHKFGKKQWESIDDKTASYLRRFDRWVRCSCKAQCGLEWNFANEKGLCRRRPINAQYQRCYALQRLRSKTFVDSSPEHEREGKEADAKNWNNWEEPGTHSNAQRQLSGSSEPERFTRWHSRGSG